MFVYKYAYDGNGNPILKEENGKVTAYGYDALNRLQEVIYPGNVKERLRMMRTATGSRESSETYWSNMSMIIAID